MGIQDRLRAALRTAMKNRDAAGSAAARAGLAVIANAEAVPSPPDAEVTRAAGPVAWAVEGLGAAERPRRELSEADQERLVADEVAALWSAAREYRAGGHEQAAARAETEARFLTDLL